METQSRGRLRGGGGGVPSERTASCLLLTLIIVTDNYVCESCVRGVPCCSREHTLDHHGLMQDETYGVCCVHALEMSTGKIPFLEAVNGSTVLLPCTYASCIGITNLYVKWEYNDNGTMQKLADSVIPTDHVEPNKVNVYRERVEYVGSSKENNISILLWNVTFEDAGIYICFGKNPKEKGRNHSAIFTLYVVDELRKVDNTLTIIIASCVGGFIAFLMAFMLIKNFTLFVLAKIEEKNKECLVTSSGIDNTENGLSGSKSTPKKA